MGVLSTVFGVGGGFGIVLSGVIVDHMSWRWIFVFGSIPVAAAVLLVRRFVPESPIRSPSRVDVPGALILSAALVALMLALTQGEPWGWTSARILGLGLLSATLFVVWGVVEQRIPQPMVDMQMLAHRPVLLTNLATLIAGFALFSCFVLVPTFVETPSSVGYGFGAHRDRGGALPAAELDRAALRGPAGRDDGQAVGVEVAARRRDGLGQCRRPRARREPRRALARARLGGAARPRRRLCVRLDGRPDRRTPCRRRRRAWRPGSTR